MIPQSRQNFIEDNREVLEGYYSKSDSQTRPVYGFGVYSPRAAFEAILESSDGFYLPLCFVYIFWDFKDEESRKFVLQSLESFHFIDDEGKIIDPVMSYVYSYCLCKTDEGLKSYDILKILADECFPPALATMGDGCIANQDIAGALDWYDHAFEHDYVRVIGRYKKLLYKSAPIIRKIPSRLKANLVSLVIFMKMIPKGIEGEHALYLDFYGMSYHLKKYWETPKSKREKKLGFRVIKNSFFASKVA